MPREAIKLNAVDKILPLEEIAPFIQKFIKTKE
jgi:chemotaxis response regulator CheB